MRMDVVGFGALNVDKLYRVKKIVRAGEESIITRYYETPGGSAANTIVGLARLGMKVGYIGKVANDIEGKLHLQSLKEENVDITKVIICKEGKSGTAIGFVDEYGERVLYIHPGVNDSIKFEEIDTTYLRNTKFLHITSFVGEHPFKVQKKVIQTLSEVKLSFDPGELYVRRGFAVLKPFIKKCDVLFLNEREQKKLTGKNFKTGSKILLETGVQIVAIKLGEKGCYVTNGREQYLIDSYKVKVVDTTGAGDAYCAGFLYGHVRRKDLYMCGQLGNLVASYKIQKIGAREGLPTHTTIEKILS
jgi:ribokinase